ncbi:hypothetical protein F3J45_23410 [Pantoea sp. Ap-967]|uniref:hypothetical protein n=1 Tax=Pantoea sp. Ap-967 TaxID=2608362 RepID=UPI001421463A|nr:hypothetical protein [Pantoea sp. Ap-967]NIE77388.1 hypothetical protein [Pantoea sp. Ap-967]
MSEQEKAPATQQSQFFVVSLKKVAIVSFFTFGWYWLFCFHRSWVLHRRYTGERVLPLIRALFAAFFVYSLLRRVDKKICSSGRRYQWSPLAITLVFIVSCVVTFYVEHGLYGPSVNAAIIGLFLLDVLNVWCVVIMQRAINYSEGDVSGEANSAITVFNWLWMALGLLIWPSLILAVLAGLLMGID